MMKLSKKTQKLVDDYDTKAKDWGYFTERSPFSFDGIDKARKEYNDSKDKLVRRILFLERKIQNLETQTKDFADVKQRLLVKILTAENKITELETANVSGKKCNRKA